MRETSLPAYFLWVGSNIPNFARLSVLSAAEAGFETELFTDREQDIKHGRLTIVDYREIYSQYTPEDITIHGSSKPVYAAFSDIFRFALLSKRNGWWFDCDTLILRPSGAFDGLFADNTFVLAREDKKVVNGAVIGSRNRKIAQELFHSASNMLPILRKWGDIGPALISQMLHNDKIEARILNSTTFYPIHHSDISKIYLPKYREEIARMCKDAYCVSLWGEVLARSGLRNIAPPVGSYLSELLTPLRHLGQIETDLSGTANYLAENLIRLEELDSGSVALRTLLKKGAAKFLLRR